LDTLSIQSVGAANNGTVTIGGTTVTYTPNADYTGSDSFTYTISDGNGATDTATVNVEVTRTNDAPAAADDNYTTNEDVELTVAVPGVLLNDTAADDDPLEATLVSGPSHGTLTLDRDGSFSYLPDPDFNGTDSFTYKADDGIAQSDSATVTLTVNAVNDAPEAIDDSATTDQDMEKTIDVLANDIDVDSTTLSVTGASDPSNGTAVINADNTITYTPNQGFDGVDTFTYTVSDGSESDTGTVSVDVTQAGPAMYVYDIRFEPRKGGRDWQALVEVRDDLHRPIAGATVTVDFYGETYIGPTDANGVFRTGWAVKVTRGTHYADVVNLVMGTYTWDHDLDVEEDDDGDGYIDDFFTK
jgi:VCBS repeat-containing protein